MSVTGGGRAFKRTGLILYVHQYEETVGFYRDVLTLPILFFTDTLTCFDLGVSYLMVKRDDAALPQVLPGDDRICLRLNVPDVEACANVLRGKGILVDVQSHAWGTVAKFRDPAGNLCAFKDDAKFEQQVRDHQEPI